VACIVIDHLTKCFTGPRGEVIRAVDDLSLTVQKGEFLTLVGPSGCGKTTILRLVSGLEDPTCGSIIIDGRSMNGIAPKARDIAMVFQSPALYPHLTARDNIGFGLRLRKCPRAERDRRVQEAAELLNLTDCLDRRPAELSGGQCQRVALGRAIVRRPAVFLFDEPLSNLDLPTRIQLRAQIARLHKQLGATVIYVTHDQSEASLLGHRIAVMNQGVIQQVATARELYGHPRNLFVAGFIGSPGMNFFNGTIVAESGWLQFEARASQAGNNSYPLKAKCSEHCAGALKRYVGKQVILGIRPEDLRHKTDTKDISRPENSIRAVVEFVEQSAGTLFLHVRHGEAAFVAQARATNQVSVGQTVCLELDPAEGRFFNPTTGEAIACES
jgi:multiple sugar transport system ATP-binding protein